MSSEANYEAVLADLRQKRARIDMAIAFLEEQMLGGPGGSPLGPPPEGGESLADAGAGSIPEQPATLSKQVKEDTFFNLSATDAARKYLGMMKRPAATAEMVAAFQQGGFLTTAKNFYSNLYTSLKRSPDFVSVKGKWALAEWYPTRPRPAKKTAGGGAEDDSEAEPKAAPKRPTALVARPKPEGEEEKKVS
jgi:hypothetical protein